MRVVAEYDENSCVWLVDIATKTRVPLAHGTVLDLCTITPPHVPPPVPGAPPCPLTG